MNPELIATIVLAVLSVLAAWVVFAVLRAPLRDLMSRTVGLDSATKFYERLLILGLLYVAIATVSGSAFNLGKDPKFMTYVWRVGLELNEALAWITGFLALYVVLITIILASHRSGHDR
jgi:hypothetical protein